MSLGREGEKEEKEKKEEEEYEEEGEEGGERRRRRKRKSDTEETKKTVFLVCSKLQLSDLHNYKFLYRSRTPNSSIKVREDHKTAGAVLTRARSSKVTFRFRAYAFEEESMDLFLGQWKLQTQLDT